MGAENDAFTAFSFISFAVVLIPLPWHLEVWNTGTCLYMLWTATGCFILFIDSIIWDGSTENWAPLWCDISTRLIIGVSVAIPAASLCINRRLYTIARVRTVTTTWADRRRAILIDLSIGLGIPIIVMILQYVVQGHRFDIFEDLGCRTFIYNTPLAYPLVFVPPVVLGMISAVFSALTIRAFSLRHAEFKQFMNSNNMVTFNRYIRLMVLAALDILLTVPFTAYIVYSNLTQGKVAPWISWEDTHSGFSRIDHFPAALWKKNPAAHVSLELSRWGVVISALLFFALFGFADEAMKNYRKAYGHVASRLGVTVKSASSSSFRGTPGSSSNGYVHSLSVA
ncbi:STE3-like pheromone receptor [Pluteus cervinus]|uniref:STE3-like pheromone receptor n=1 Tax=Pluteus cervinus TaxID=181527 RepID=A0ACD3BCK5_9AGAR|nr:STE3-like pheromone receptor [Pluteus cervinus]